MILKNNTGIIQDEYQAHSAAYWQEEFKIVNQLVLDYIKSILDYYKSKKNYSKY